jgi:hypothetical protein
MARKLSRVSKLKRKKPAWNPKTIETMKWLIAVLLSILALIA